MRQSALIRCLAAGLLAALSLPAQTGTAKKPEVDRASSYYHFSMGHLYAELAGSYGNRGEYLNQAIDHYREAMKADPDAAFLAEELSDLYIQSGRIREGVSEAEAALRQNPDDLNARRILGRIYTRIMGDSQAGRVNDQLLNKAIEQFTEIVKKEPTDKGSWLMLGRLQKVAQNSVESEKAFDKALELDPENEDAMMGLAMVYSDLGDARRASEMLKKVAARQPNPRTLVALAGSYEQMREYGLAAETYRQALEMAPDNDELKRALAQSLVLSEKYDEALKLYQELVADEPKDVQSWLRISQIYRQQRDFAKAREASDKAKDLAPDSLEILYNEVGILEAEGKTPEAIAAMKKVVDSTAKKTYSAAEKSSRLMLLERLGLLYRSNDQYEDAIAAFREMAGLEEAVAARASAQIIDTYRQGHQFRKAEEEADAAAAKFPEDRTVRVVRATVLADVGRAAEGAAELEKLLDGKNDRETYLQLVQIHEKGRNFDKMAAAIDSAEKLSVTPDDKEVIHFLRGAMYEKMKKNEQSEAEFRKLLELNPESASALNYLGYMWADRNVNLAEATTMIQKALQMEPNNGAYLDSLGWAYYRQGKLEEAETNLREAMRRTSKDPTVHDHLADVLAKRGNWKEAVQHWEASIQLYGDGPPADSDPAEVAKIQHKLDAAKVHLAREPK
ncbi:MAG: tetratricopeptide repeat protein [Bryobacteraceae bacterium]